MRWGLAKADIIQGFPSPSFLVSPMLVFRGFSHVAPAATALTIGNFDGVHLGHRALLGRLGEKCRAQGLLPTAITFEPHPREFFDPAGAPTRLSTLREKLELIAADGVELAYVARFDAALAKLTADEFVEQVLVRSGRVKALIIGDDFCFGADRKGSLEMLRGCGDRFGFAVEALPSVILDGVRVSSSVVREALAQGEMERAAMYLGRAYSIDGRVVHGDKVGRQLGFHTANIRIKHSKSPLSGVFAVEVHGLAGGPHRGVANLGVRPSANQLSRPLLEVHLFDFSANIYGYHLNVRFLHKLRDEVRFSGLDALKAQIALDVANAQAYFKH